MFDILLLQETILTKQESAKLVAAEIMNGVKQIQCVAEIAIADNNRKAKQISLYEKLLECESDDGQKGTCREQLPYNKFRWCRGCLNADQMESLLEEENARDGS